MWSPPPSAVLAIVTAAAFVAIGIRQGTGLVAVVDAFQTPDSLRANNVHESWESHNHRRRRINYYGRQCGALCMSPPTVLADEEEKIKTVEMSPATLMMKTKSKESNETPPKTRKKKKETNSKNRWNGYFNMTSSVRSTTQTDAMGRGRQRRPRAATDSERGSIVASEEDDDDESLMAAAIPPEVLRPFSFLLLSQFVLFLGVGAVIPTIPLYGQSIGLSSSLNGVVISAPAVALLLISRNAGVLADKGRKAAMMGGMALIAVSDLGTALSSSLATLVVARLGLGLGRGYAEAGERGMLADLANLTPRLRGRALALQQACVALGVALGAPLGGLVVEEYGARSAFLCVSAAALFALAIYAVLPETVTKELVPQDDVDEKAVESRAESNGDEDSDVDSEAADWLRLLQTSSTWRSLAVAQSGMSFGYACKIAIIPILANAYLGGATGAGLLLSAAGLAGLVGAPLGGFLTDKAGPRAAAAAAGSLSGASLALIPVGLSLKDADVASLMGSSTSLDGLSSLLSGAVGGPQAAAFAALVLLWSVGASAQGPALTALAQEKAPVGSEATALGLPRAVGDGTYIIAPLLLGYVADTELGGVVPGISCAVAGAAICVGSAALFLLGAQLEEEERG